jgi:hypothetical protein
MTITHDEQIGLQLSGHSLLMALISFPTATFRRFRRRHLDAVQTRATAKLPAYLKHDIGEIDQRPTPIPTFMQHEPSSYQDRLQQKWLR